MSATVTIITSYIDSPSQFKALDLHERRDSSVGWREFPSRTGRYPGSVLVSATQLELGAFECDPKVDRETDERVHTFAIDRTTHTRTSATSA